MTFYLPILPGPYSKSTPTDWVGECPLASMTREEVIKDIERGQISPPTRVLVINESAGTVRDVTADIAIDVGDLTFGPAEPVDADERYELVDWLDHHKAGWYGWKAALRGKA